MKSIQTQAIFTSFRSRTDGSIGASLVTPELKPAEKTVFFELQNLNVRLLITPLDEAECEVEEVKTELQTKTQAQRIRGCIFRIWEAKGKDGDFEQFYREKTEKIINVLKDQIDQ